MIDNLAGFTKMNSTDRWGTGIILQNPNTGLFLLGKRKDTKNYATPGGKCEMGETPIQGVIRECKEESNIDIKSLKHYGTLLHESEVTGSHWVSFLFYSNDYDDSEIVAQEEEMEDFKYYSLEEVMDLDLFPPTRASFEHLIPNLSLDNKMEEIPYVDFPSTPSRVSSEVDVYGAYSYIEKDTIF